MESRFRRDLLSWLAGDAVLTAGLNAIGEESPLSAPPPWLGIAASASAEWGAKDARGREVRVALELVLRAAGRNPRPLARTAPPHPALTSRKGPIMPEPILTTARTPRHQLPFLFAGQSQKEAFVNEALARLDALVQPAVLGEAAVPPLAPANGDSYLVGASATGEWAGHEGAIATWADPIWLFATAFDGARTHDAASGSIAVFNQAEGWRRAIGPDVPTGGATQDLEARAAIAAIVAGLHRLGIFSA